MASGPITLWQTDGEKVETVTDFIFLGCKITTDSDCTHKIKRHLVLEEKLYRHKQHIEKQRHYFADKGLSSQSYGFSSTHVGRWELDHKEGWALKNWCFQIVMLGKAQESLGLQGNQTSLSQRKSTLNIHCKDWCWSWSFNMWPPDAKNQFIWKNPDAGENWGQE